MTRPRPAIVVAVLSALALIAGLAVIVSAGSGSSVASQGARPAAGSSTDQSASDPVSTGDPSSDSPSALPEGVRRLSDRMDATEIPQRDLSAVPRQITIPSLGVDAPIDIVGLIGDGKVEVPTDVRRTGWYQYSQVAGSSIGSTVVVGHKDGVEQGAGAFYNLGELQLGDRIVVTTEAGEGLRYEVVARESFDKEVVPLADLFSGAGPHRLTLITCGGPFDATTLGYTDNVVITAVALSDRRGDA